MSATDGAWSREVTGRTTVDSSSVEYGELVDDLLNEYQRCKLRIQAERQAIEDCRRIAAQELRVSPVDFNRMVKEGLRATKKGP